MARSVVPTGPSSSNCEIASPPTSTAASRFSTMPTEPMSIPITAKAPRRPTARLACAEVDSFSLPSFSMGSRSTSTGSRAEPSEMGRTPASYQEDVSLDLSHAARRASCFPRSFRASSSFFTRSKRRTFIAATRLSSTVAPSVRTSVRRNTAEISSSVNSGRFSSIALSSTLCCMWIRASRGTDDGTDGVRGSWSTYASAPRAASSAMPSTTHLMVARVELSSSTEHPRGDDRRWTPWGVKGLRNLRVRDEIQHVSLYNSKAHHSRK
eukprot:scaffold73339_cov60-Phaeocystis_antarctica.AAC.4